MVLCILYKFWCISIYPLYGALPVPYVPARVTSGALIGHRYAYAPSRCRTSQYSKIFMPLSVSLWNDLSDPVFEGVRLAGFKSRANVFFYWPKLLASFFLSTFFPFSSFFLYGGIVGLGVIGLIGWGVNRSLPAVHCGPFFNYNNDNSNHGSDIL